MYKKLGIPKILGRTLGGPEYFLRGSQLYFSVVFSVEWQTQWVARNTIRLVSMSTCTLTP